MENQAGDSAASNKVVSAENASCETNGFESNNRLQITPHPNSDNFSFFCMKQNKKIEQKKLQILK